MGLLTNDTIAAIATPSGMGGVGIIRISGKAALATITKLTSVKLNPRLATYATLFDANQEILDEVILLYFKAPHSYTGEDVVEIQGHGGIYVMQSVLKAVLASGARQARPGEFSERAFLNNKMDLVQVEAVADLIESRSKSASAAALKSLKGEFSERIQDLQTTIIELRVYVEAALDFSDEEIDFLSEGKIQDKIDTLKVSLQNTIRQAGHGRLLHEGVQVVLVGEPNAGKSSLLNLLLGEERAIVTSEAGTTRDTLEETLLISDIPVRLIDTAGLRETEDNIEKVGIERAKKAIEKADLAIWLRDASNLTDKLPVELNGLDHLEVHNKSDLLTSSQANTLNISAKTGQGIDELLTQIAKRIIPKHNEEGIFSARERHIKALHQTLEHIDMASKHIEQLQTSELVAEELRLAQHCLSEITGEYTSDDLLGAIFSSFCIGK